MPLSVDTRWMVRAQANEVLPAARRNASALSLVSSGYTRVKAGRVWLSTATKAKSQPTFRVRCVRSPVMR